MGEKDLFGQPLPKKRVRKKREPVDTTGWPLVVQFSGGKTSGLMTKQLVDSGRKPIVLFENTGRENNETLDFVNECDRRWGWNVVWLEYRHDPTKGFNGRGHDVGHTFAVVNHETAARIGQPGPFDTYLQWMLDRESGTLPYQLACQQMCASVRNTRSLGGAVQSESYDYYSYQMAPAAEQALMLGSVKQLLGDLKEWVW